MNSTERIQLSIITVTFNAQATIGLTIKSILSQDFRPIEWIHIDGNSSDKTVEIAKELTKNTTLSTTIISEPDTGIYDAMNKGMAHAKGRYIFFLNSGDIFTSNTSLSAAIKSHHNADLIYSPIITSNLRGQDVITPIPQTLSAESMKAGMAVSHQGIIVSREISAKYDLQYRYTSDYDWAIRCIDLAQAVVRSDTPLVRYLGDGFSAVNFYGCLRNNINIFVKHFGILALFFQIPRLMKSIIRNTYIYLAHK